MGARYLETNANFIMINLFSMLFREKGMIIRPGFLFGMPGWLRVTIGTEEQNQRFLDLPEEILKE